MTRTEVHPDRQCRNVTFTWTETVMSVTFDEADPYSPGLLELVRWRLEKLWERSRR